MSHGKRLGQKTAGRITCCLLTSESLVYGDELSLFRILTKETAGCGGLFECNVISVFCTKKMSKLDATWSGTDDAVLSGRGVVRER